MKRSLSANNFLTPRNSLDDDLSLTLNFFVSGIFHAPKEQRKDWMSSSLGGEVDEILEIWKSIEVRG